MNTLDAMLAAVVAAPAEDTIWLAMADWLDENDHGSERGELLRLHRKLLATCCEPDASPERAGWQSRIVELLVAGVQPCVPRKTLVLPGGVPMDFALVPPGGFVMGSTHPEGSDDEKPVHRVDVTKGFFLGAHPVTKVQWEAVMGKSPGLFRGENRPVGQVSWDDATEFCRKLTATQGAGPRLGLPSEAEWEWACRAGTTTEYHFGDAISTDLVNYNGTFSWNGSPEGKNRQAATDVGSFPCNAWGLWDLHGNVWEWCRDAFDEHFYQRSPAQDPVRDDGEENIRVMRGGSWCDAPEYCRAALRRRGGRGYRLLNVGFRVRLPLDGSRIHRRT